MWESVRVANVRMQTSGLFSLNPKPHTELRACFTGPYTSRLDLLTEAPFSIVSLQQCDMVQRCTSRWIAIHSAGTCNC